MTLNLSLDCHMHSSYSDGCATVDEMAASALEKGLTAIAITDHMPLPFETRYAMDPNRMEAYRRDIDQARQRWKGRLTILAGLEIEYIPRHRDWIKNIISQGWDILLVSIHGIASGQGHYMVNGREDEFIQTLATVFKNDIRAFCAHYYRLIREAAATGWFDVAGHMDVIKKHNPDNRYFNERDDWYRALVLETLDSIAAHGLKLEINMNGLNHRAATPYPSPWIIHEAAARGIPLILGSDAHAPGRQGQYFQDIYELLGKDPLAARPDSPVIGGNSATP